MEALTGAEPAATRRPEEAPALVLVGFMGAGKSTGALAAAAELGTGALDSDRELERGLGEPIESFFDRAGEAAFREREERTVLELLDRGGGHVVALGGGAVESEAVRRALGRHVVVHVDVDPDEAWQRASGKGRPLARDRGRFDRLHHDRRALYESVADAWVPGGREHLRAAVPALRALLDAPPGSRPRLVWAHAASGDYPVFLARGLLSGGFFHPPDGRRFLVTDENVARAQGEAVEALAGPDVATIPAGEEHKTLARVEEVLRAMARAEVERGDLVVALGGGVVGDIAGLCAALYQRGVRCVQAPTTVVAQVDSAYGGKTGVDLPEGKNYAGVYHQPATVLVDFATLDTLPAAERAAGYAEVVKTALIAGGDLWVRVRQGGDPDERVILECARTKLAVVAEDERDAGRRRVLNLGHTVAHALEAATGYRRFRHGEAVALGLLCALRLSGQDALRSEVVGLLAARGLPQRAEGVDVERVVELLDRDKKRRSGRVEFVLVDSPGAVSAGHALDAAAVRAAIVEVIGG